MSPQISSEAEAFYDYLGHQLGNGGKSLSPEQLLSQWRELREREETIVAVRAGYADAEAGRMRPLREMINESQRDANAS